MGTTKELNLTFSFGNVLVNSTVEMERAADITFAMALCMNKILINVNDN